MAMHIVSDRCRASISRISCSSESEEWSIINLNPRFPKEFNFDDEYVFVECSGNGMVCFSYEDSVGRFRDDVFVIWNPSTDNFQLIPHTDSRYLPCYCSSRRCIRLVNTYASGLGFVPESHDYKFVRFMKNRNKEGCCGEQHSSSQHVAVYSSKNNSWKELPFPFSYYSQSCSVDDSKEIFPRITDVATCVNGFLYWATCTHAILSFDLSTDKFSTLPFPHDIAQYDFEPQDDVSLLELDGSLCLVIKLKKKKAKTRLLCFWVYTSSPSPSPWTRKINLDVCLDARTKPLWLGNKNINSLVLLLQGSDGALLEYNYATRELKKIDQIHGNRDLMAMLISTIAQNKNINSATCEFDGWKAHLRPHSKRRKGDVVDWISQLPDDMIVHILSFLSLKEAASTSVLSTRWSELWRHTPNLNFKVTHFKRYKPKYIKWVNSFVELHRALSLKEFTISFPLNYSTRTTVTKWLEFAFSRRVEVLELNLFGRRFDFLENSFLQERRIFESSNLKSLCLKCLEVSGEAIGLFLRNCPLLERLIIEYAALTSDLEVCGRALKHLEIQGCIGGKSIKGYAPNLTCLKIDSCPFVINNIKQRWNRQQSADDPPVFCLISSQLTTLEFTLRCPRPPKGFFEKGFPQMPSMRELILTYLGCGHGIRPITSLICAFPYLEDFEIKCFLRRSRDKQQDMEDCMRSRVEQQGMEAVNDVERFCHWHLRVFKFTWFDVGDGDHMELMSYILDNCVALQKIVLDIYGADSPSFVAAGEYVKQLQSRLPTHIQLIVSFNNRQLELV